MADTRLTPETGAEAGTRTRTTSRSLPPKGSASADSATPAPPQDSAPYDLRRDLLEMVARFERDYMPAQVERDRKLDTEKWRIQRHQRRAAGEMTVTMSQLGEREGWICVWSRLGQCVARSRRIDPKLSGNHPLGATIEHLVPVSKGGTNAIENLAVSHRRCNSTYGNHGTVQMRLLP